MEDLFKDDEFAQFIINDYFADKNMTDEDKLLQVAESVEEFSMAMDCFKLSGGTAREH